MRVAIIGHGRSAEGKGWGGRIDACDCVVRMWNWHWQDLADYGTRYDYGLFEIYDSMIDNLRRFNQRQPARGWLGSYLLWSRNQDLEEMRRRFPAKTQVVDQRKWIHGEGAEIKGVGETGRWQLTRGTVAACWAIDRAKKGDVIILVGFDNVRLGHCLGVEEGFSEVYRNDPATFSFNGYKPGEVRYGNHDFSAERPLMELLASKRGASVAFSEEEWSHERATDGDGDEPGDDGQRTRRGDGDLYRRPGDEPADRRGGVEAPAGCRGGGVDRDRGQECDGGIEAGAPETRDRRRVR